MYVHGFTYSLYIVSDSVQCTEDTFCVLVHKFWTSRKRGTGEVGAWGHSKCMAAAELGCRMAMVDSGWVNVSVSRLCLVAKG